MPSDICQVMTQYVNGPHACTWLVVEAIVSGKFNWCFVQRALMIIFAFPFFVNLIYLQWTQRDAAEWLQNPSGKSLNTL